MKKLIDYLFRQWSALKRPAKNQNLERIKIDQENLGAFHSGYAWYDLTQLINTI